MRLFFLMIKIHINSITMILLINFESFSKITITKILINKKMNIRKIARLNISYILKFLQKIYIFVN
jgi:hypothetical protein